MVDFATTTEPPAYLSVWQRCTSMFREELSAESCVKAVLYANEYLADGYSQCTPDIPVQYIEHNHHFYYSRCGSIEIALLKFAIPPLMILCLCGNLLNLMIYRLSYFDGSSSVHFLRAKAIANMIFVTSRLFEVIHAWSHPANEFLEPLFWNSRVYIITISNISGTLSTWLTLMVTVETVMCVLMPFVFRQYCTKRITLTFLIVSILLSTGLHSTLLFLNKTNTMSTVKIYEPAMCFYGQISYNLMLRGPTPYMTIQKLYYWIQMAVAIIIPTVAMLVCSILIVKQFTFKELGEAFSQRRKCVIRMTVATTLSHLLLEGPATLTHAAVALKGGSSNEHNHLMCVLNHGNNLLSIMNATIPFFVFLLCSEQFRHMTTMYIRAQFQMDKAIKKTFLLQAGMRCGRTNRLTTEMTFTENHLLPRPSHVNSV